MTPDEFEAHAQRIVSDYLDEGIEFCHVYEDEQLEDESGEIQEAIWVRVNKILRTELS